MDDNAKVGGVMDLRELRYFVELARELNFTKAARNLYVSQSALSKTIAKLEKQLGLSLIVRSGNQFVLSGTGKYLYNKGKLLLDEFDQLSAELHDMGQKASRTIRIGVPPLLNTRAFSSVLLNFHNRYPAISIFVADKGAREIISQVQGGELTLGVAVKPVDTSQFHSVDLCEEQLCAVLHPQNSLAGQDTLTLDQMKDQVLYTYYMHDLILSRCEENGIVPNIGGTNSQCDTLLEMARQGGPRSLILLPRMALDAMQLYVDMPVKRFSPPFSYGLCLIYKKDKKMPPACQELINDIQNYFHQRYQEV